MLFPKNYNWSAVKYYKNIKKNILINFAGIENMYNFALIESKKAT